MLWIWRIMKMLRSHRILSDDTTCELGPLQVYSRWNLIYMLRIGNFYLHISWTTKWEKKRRASVSEHNVCFIFNECTIQHIVVACHERTSHFTFSLSRSLSISYETLLKKPHQNSNYNYSSLVAKLLSVSFSLSSFPIHCLYFCFCEFLKIDCMHSKSELRKQSPPTRVKGNSTHTWATYVFCNCVCASFKISQCLSASIICSDECFRDE